ncbi:MAG: hypothetical protein H0U76_29265 [Ktedonobacteraceae bacterium]|nr:hypothetical protein [Ktedonobacteraceae bacterium]
MGISEQALAKILRQPGYSAVVETAPTSKTVAPGSTLEQKFLSYWQALNGPALEREVRFNPTRKFRFDFAHVATATAIEIEGFGHAKRNRYTADLEKYNSAALLGWTLIRLTSPMINAVELQRIINHIKERTG